MAKRYDNDFDAEGFVENFRAKEYPPTPSETGKSGDSDITKVPTVSDERKPRNRKAGPSKDSPSETVIGFKEKYIDSLKYKSPNKRFPQVGIHPDFVKVIKRLEDANGTWGCSVSTYINNVLAVHFKENEAIINDLLENSYCDE